MDLTSLKKKACEAIDNAANELRAVNKDVYENPELAFEEICAHNTLASFLEKHGFPVERSYKLATAFRCEVGSRDAGPSVAVLCEYDALPGLGHACGHNLIAELGVAASLGIKVAMEAAGKPFGRLVVLGTPAEEGGGGKIDLINAGAFHDIDAAMMAHPSQFMLPKPVYVAMTQVKVTYIGKAAHASSFPWEGINALDAAVLCYQSVSCLRQQMKPTWRVHGVITNGGAKPNIIPGETELLYYLRAPTDSDLQILKAKFIGCIEGAAQTTGCKVEYHFDPKPYSALVSNSVLADLYVENGQSIGLQFETDPGKLLKQGGSTDMGNVSHVVPSIHPKYAIGTEASGHSTEFYAASGTEVAHQSTLLVAKSLAMTALDVFLRPDLLPRIKQDFTQCVLNKVTG